MLKAAALTYGLLVMLLVGSICGSLLLFSGLHAEQTTALVIEDQLQHNARSGIELLLASPAGDYREQVVDLYDQDHDSVHLIHRPWGGYEYLVSEAFHGSRVHRRAALAGYQPDREGTALYLTDRNRPLKLCGRTEVRGKVHLPKAGVERAYIEGQTYAGDKLIYGSQTPSERQIPKLDDALVERNRAYLSGEVLDEDSVGNLADLPFSHNHSHHHRTLLIDGDQSVDLANYQLSGNIIVRASKAIYIGADTKLDGILCYAPYIFVESGFQGECQLIARDSLHISEDCHLTYPSLLATFETEHKDNAPSISVAERSMIEGPVLVWQEKAAIRFPPYVKLAEESQVMGQVYARGMVEIRGAVSGSVYCDKFILNTPSSVYENHLLNAVIDQEALSEHYAGCFLPGMTDQKTIVKWLN